MTAATTGLRAPSVRPAVSGRALVVIGDEVPDWVQSWCSRTAREVRHRPVPGRAAEPESADRLSAIADVAAGAARSGNAVLALPAVPQVRSAPPRVVAAVRQLPDDAQILTDAALSAAHLGADLVVAHGLPASFGERSVGLDAAVRDAARLLDAAVDAAATSAPGLHVQGWLARVRPHELVGEQLDADLLVWAARARTGTGGSGSSPAVRCSTPRVPSCSLRGSPARHRACGLRRTVPSRSRFEPLETDRDDPRPSL